MIVFCQEILHTLQVGLKSLSIHKLRSTLTILGVVLGVGSVIVMLAVGEGAKIEAIQQIHELGATNIILRSVKPTGATDENQGESTRYGLTGEDLNRIEATVPTVVSVTPMRERRSELRYQRRGMEGRVVGVTPNYQELNGLRLREGRFITALDAERFAKVAVLAAQTAETLFPFEAAVGRSIRIGQDQYFEVIGITEARARSPSLGSSLPAQDYNQDVYIPLPTDKACLGETITSMHGGTAQREALEFSQITVGVDEMRNVKKTAELIGRFVNQAHKQSDTTMTVPLDLLEQAERTQRLFTMVLGAIASISLMVGGIGIMNIMLATVTERTREIGIRRALGAKRSHITWQFLIETIVLSSSGGIIGLCLGVSLSALVMHVFAMKTVVRVWTLLLAFTISVAVGLIFGTYPARRAATMDPIEALRHE